MTLPGSVVVFAERSGADEVPYLRWLDNHPDGFVLNAGRRPSTRSANLHRATCWTIRFATRATTPSPFTGESYIKVCATTDAELLTWRQRERGRDGFRLRCAFCAP